MLSIDEKSQIQALEWAAPVLALQPGLPEARSHDYVRHGTSTLFAALEVRPASSPRHSSQGTATKSSSPSCVTSPAPTPTATCIW